MYDQANQLRALVRESAMQQEVFPPPRKIVIGGGKGGVGTTTIAVKLAISLAQQGCRTVLVDADMNRADVATLCNLEVRETISDVLSARRTVHEVLQRGPAGVQVLPGSWSPTSVPDCSPGSQERLIRELDRLGRHADLIVLDVGNGLNNVVKRFWEAADLVLVTTSTDTVSIMDAYAAIKVLPSQQSNAVIRTVINRADELTGEQVHSRILQACRRFLGLEIEQAACLPFFSAPNEATGSEATPASESSSQDFIEAIETLAVNLLHDPCLQARAPRTLGHKAALASA
ncbi:MAG: AAA family ATPase [Planctomycetota bacterium]|nr:AAA family ATPase [Planctomycetota bacterium]